MPLAFASILSSSVTLVSTSTNLVVSGLIVDWGLPRIGMFELSPVGIPIAIVGAFYLMFIGRRLIPDRGEAGEPLDNFENLMQAIRIINFDKGINIGARHITVSTVGILPGMAEFAKRPEHNWQVLNRLETVVGLGLPVLIGPSRKRFLGDATGRPVSDVLSTEVLFGLVDALEEAKAWALTAFVAFAPVDAPKVAIAVMPL